MSFDRDTRWTIPLTYTTSSERDFNSSRVVWFPESEDRMKLPGVCLDDDEWIVLNIRQIGELMVHPIFMYHFVLLFTISLCHCVELNERETEAPKKCFYLGIVRKFLIFNKQRKLCFPFRLPSCSCLMFPHPRQLFSNLASLCV